MTNCDSGKIKVKNINILRTDHHAQLLITPAGAIWESRASLLNRQGVGGGGIIGQLKAPEGVRLMHVAGPLNDKINSSGMFQEHGDDKVKALHAALGLLFVAQTPTKEFSLYKHPATHTDEQDVARSTSWISAAALQN